MPYYSPNNYLIMKLGEEKHSVPKTYYYQKQEQSEGNRIIFTVGMRNGEAASPPPPCRINYETSPFNPQMN